MGEQGSCGSGAGGGEVYGERGKGSVAGGTAVGFYTPMSHLPRL